jgi:hypothetical protein
MSSLSRPRHAQQDDTPHVPPTGKEPLPVDPEGVVQLNADIIFLISLEPHEGHSGAPALALITRTLNIFSHFLH